MVLCQQQLEGNQPPAMFSSHRVGERGDSVMSIVTLNGFRNAIPLQDAQGIYLLGLLAEFRKGWEGQGLSWYSELSPACTKLWA